MKKVREAREAGPAQDTGRSERQEDGPLREPGVTLAREKGRSRTAEVRGRAAGGGGRDKGDVETRPKGRATSARRGIRDAIGPIRRPEGWLVLEDGTQQDEKVTLTNGSVRAPIESRRFPFAKGRTQDTGSRPKSDESQPLYAKSSAVVRFRAARSAKRSVSGAAPAGDDQREAVRSDWNRRPVWRDHQCPLVGETEPKAQNAPFGPHMLGAAPSGGVGPL
jgi:hypothetical protein